MFTTSDPDQAISAASLRYRWAVFVFLSFLVWAFGYGFLRANWQPIFALRWLVLSLSGLLYAWKALWDGLPVNHRIGDTRLLPNLGPGNDMTLLRGVLIALLLGFLFSPRPAGWLAWIPGLLYTLAVLADFLDGFLARASGQVTRLGELLDMRFDGLGVLVAALLLVQYRQVPPWYLLVGLARYLFLAGEWLLRWLGKPIYELPPSDSRRAMAGLQMGFIFILSWPLFTPPGTYLAAAVISAPFLVGFLRDGLLMSGVLKTDGSEMLPAWRSFATRWLPLVVRIAAASLLIVDIYQRGRTLGEPLEGFELAVAVLLFVGAGGRLTAIAGLLLLGFVQRQAGLNELQNLLVILLTGSLYLGSGPLAIWTPGEYLIHHKVGGARQAASQSRAEAKEMYAQAAE